MDSEYDDVDSGAATRDDAVHEPHEDVIFGLYGYGIVLNGGYFPF